MSEINPGRWREPFTRSGVRPESDGAAGFFHLHEIGSKICGAEWNHRDVCSPFWRCYHNTAQGAAVRWSGGRIELRPDRVVLVPAETRFDCLPGGPVGHTWVHFSVPPTTTPGPAPVTVKLPAYARALAREVRVRARSEPGDARLAHAVWAWLHVLWNLADLGGETARSPRLARVLALIEARLARPPTVGELAAASGMSAGAFIRWFKAETGTTPAEAMTRRRVAEAGRLLRYTESSVEQVASKVGYSNRYHFSRVFARVAGCGPATFRRGSGA